MLQKQKIAIPLTGGLSDKVSNLIRETQFLEELENVDCNKIGEITKRHGSSILRTFYNPNPSKTAKHLFTDGENLGVIGDTSTIKDEVELLSGSTGASFFKQRLRNNFVSEEVYSIHKYKTTSFRTLETDDFLVTVYLVDIPFNPNSSVVNERVFLSVYNKALKAFVVRDEPILTDENITFYLASFEIVQFTQSEFYIFIVTDGTNAFASSEIQIQKIFLNTGSFSFSRSVLTTYNPTHNIEIELTTKTVRSIVVSGLIRLMYVADIGSGIYAIRVINFSFSNPTIINESASLLHGTNGKIPLSFEPFIEQGVLCVASGWQDNTDSGADNYRWSVRVFKFNSFTSSSQAGFTVLERLENNSTWTEAPRIDGLNVISSSDTGVNGDCYFIFNSCLEASFVDKGLRIIEVGKYSLSGNSLETKETTTSVDLTFRFLSGQIAGKSYWDSSNKAIITPIVMPQGRDVTSLRIATYGIIETTFETGSKNNGYPIHKVLNVFSRDTAKVENDSVNLTAQGISFLKNEDTFNVSQYYFRGYSIKYYEFQKPEYRTKLYRDHLLFNGSPLQVYDGHKLYEAGFLHSPILSSPIAPFSVGGNLSDGIVQLKLCFRYITARGEEIFSQPSIPFAIDLNFGTSTQSFRIGAVYPYMGIDESINDIRNIEICYFLTEVNGSVFYLHDIRKYDEQKDFDDVYLTVDDLTGLISKRILYTESGEDENKGVGQARYLEVFDNRLFVGGGLNADKIIYSKQNRLTFYASEIGKDIPKGEFKPNGLVSLDNRLLVFKKNQVYQIFGNGADLFGNGNYQNAVKLPFEQGLKDENSLVVSTQGVFFRAIEGIYLIDRGLSLAYIGKEVEDHLGDLEIVDAISKESSNEIIFSSKSIVGPNPSIGLVFNYENQIWHVNTEQSIASSVNFNNKHHFLSGTSEVHFADKNTYRDGENLGMDWRLKTAWIKLNGLTGYQRLWRGTLQGIFKGAHKASVKIYYDYDDSAFEEIFINCDSPQFSIDGDYEIEFLPKKQRCKSIQFEFVFSQFEPDQHNQNAIINAIELLVGVKGTKNRISAGRRMVKTNPTFPPA